MLFNNGTNEIPSDCVYDNLHNMPTTGYSAPQPIPQSHSIVNNMVYYQGIYYQMLL